MDTCVTVYIEEDRFYLKIIKKLSLLFLRSSFFYHLLTFGTYLG